MKKDYLLWFFLAALIAGTVMIRVGGHFPNATPVAAVALLAGASLRARWAVMVPLAAMTIADAIIGFAALPIAVSVYGSFALMAVMGGWLKKERTAGRVIGAALASSILFYLITNGAVWWFSGLYTHTIDGLIFCYYLAIPFFRNTMLGDLAYTGGLFLAVQYVPVLAGLFHNWHNKIKIRYGILVGSSSDGGQK